MNTIMKFAGSSDGTSTKAEFLVAPYTIDGPTNPHNPTPAPGASAAHTSIRFPGKGLVDYGEIVCNSILNMLENFAATRPPEFPTSGQLWYDLTTGYLRVWTGTVWQATQILPSDTDPVPAAIPTEPDQYVPLPDGTLWYNTVTDKLHQRQGSGWVEVTGAYVMSAGDVMSGNLDMGGAHTVTNLAAPISTTDAATKLYVDSTTASFVTDTYMWPIANVIGLQGILDTIDADIGSLQVEIAANTAATDAVVADMSDKLSKTNGVITGTVDVQGLLSVSAGGHLRINSPIAIPTDAATKEYVDTAIAGVSGGGSTVTALNDLTDVTIGAIIPGDLIGYSLSSGAWTNQQPSTLGIAPLSHTTQASAAHPATAVSFAPPVGMVATTAQAAIESVFNTKLALTGGSMLGSLYMGNHVLGGLPPPLNSQDAATKGYVDTVTSNPRRLRTVTGATSVNTPMVRPFQNNLLAFLNGVKQYQTTIASQTIDVNHAISTNTVSTGIPEDDTVYTAAVTSTTKHQIVDKQGSSLAVYGNLAGWYTGGTTFSVVDSTGNDGSYTVTTAGATYNNTTRVTTIPTTATPPSSVIDGFVVVTAKTRNIAVRGRLAGTYAGLLARILVIQESLESVSNPGSSITIYGDYTTIFTAGVKFTLTNTENGVNDGEWTVASSSYATGKTTIVTTVAPTAANNFGALVANSVAEFNIDTGDYNLRLTGTGVGGSTTSVSWADTGAHPLMASLTDFVSIQAAIPGFTGAYIEDMRSRFRNRDDVTVFDSLLFSPPITGVIEIIATTPSL